jgi:hypothetical protein
LNELAWAETVMDELASKGEGLPQFQVQVEPAPSNEIGLRLDTVRDELTYFIDAIVHLSWSDARHIEIGIELAARRRRC